jgi:hypothetical protein
MIANRDRFPNVDFLPPKEQRIIGSAEDIPLVLLGREQGTETLIVALSYEEDFTKEKLQAVPVYELISHTQGAIVIEENI